MAVLSCLPRGHRRDVSPKREKSADPYAQSSRPSTSTSFRTVCIKLARQIKMNARGRGVLSRLAKLHRAILSLASGDLEVNLPDKLALDRDELGDMARAVQIFRENAVEKARVEAQADCASRRNRSRRVGNRRRRQAASDSPAGGEHQCQPNGAHDSAKRCDGARDGRRRE